MKRTCSNFAAFNTSSVCWVLPCKALSSWLIKVETEHSDHSDHSGTLFSTRNIPRINVAAPPFRQTPAVPRCGNTMPRLQRRPSRRARVDLLWSADVHPPTLPTIPASQMSTNCFSTLRASPGNPLALWTHKKKREEKRLSTAETCMRCQQASTPHFEALPWHLSSPESSYPCSWHAHWRPHPARQPSKNVMLGVRTTLKFVLILVGINSRFLSVRDLKNCFQTRKLESKPCARCMFNLFPWFGLSHLGVLHYSTIGLDLTCPNCLQAKTINPHDRGAKRNRSFSP